MRGFTMIPQKNFEFQRHVLSELQSITFAHRQQQRRKNTKRANEGATDIFKTFREAANTEAPQSGLVLLKVLAI